MGEKKLPEQRGLHQFENHCLSQYYQGSWKEKRNSNFDRLGGFKKEHKDWARINEPKGGSHDTDLARVEEDDQAGDDSGINDALDLLVRPVG